MGIKATAFSWAELGYFPDIVLRMAIRRLCHQLSQDVTPTDEMARLQQLRQWIADMDRSPVALATSESNEQHYEVPSAFFERVLGPHRKYSSAFWDNPDTSLEEAEDDALRRTCANADLEDGQHVLELGCGWGSLTLYMAARYPNSKITAVSHSTSQRETILSLAKARGLANVDVITCDMNDFTPPKPGTYHRVVSVEMFEHMRNYRELLSRISTWLTSDGKVFIHIFCHKHMAYPYLDTGKPEDWMTRYFFAGGMMPSDDLMSHFDEHLTVEQQWRWNGSHYSRTLEAWLALMDGQKEQIMPILRETYGADARRWWGRWRLFFMSCAEFFGLLDGEEWYVSHYRLVQTTRS